MGVRRRIGIAAGVTIASFGIPLVTSAAAYASPTTAVCGVITGPHTFTLCPGSSETVVVGELLRPDTPGYNTDVEVVAVSTNPVTGVTTVTTGDTFLPLNQSNTDVAFTVESPPVVSPPPPGSPPPPPPPPYKPRW